MVIATRDVSKEPLQNTPQHLGTNFPLRLHSLRNELEYDSGFSYSMKYR